MPNDALQTFRPLVIAAVLLLIVFMLGVASKIFIAIALGFLLSFVLGPAVAFLQARGLRRLHATLIVVFTTLLLIVLTLSSLAIQLRDLATELPDKKKDIVDKVHDLVGRDRKPGMFSRLTRMLDEISVEMQGVDPKTAQRPAITIPVRVEQERGSNFALVSVFWGPLSATLGSIGLTLGLTVSMLLTREDLRNRMFLLLGDGNVTSTTRALDEVSKRISSYLFTQVILNAAYGTVFGISLYILGVPYALVWGVLAGILRFIPYIGTWMGAIFPLLVSLATPGWWQPISVICTVLFLGILANSVLEPMLVSRSTGVTPMALVLSMAFWTWLWGPIGLILSTPITTCLCVLGKYVPSLRFLDILLGTAMPVDPERKLYQRLVAHDEVEAGDLLEQYLAEHTPEDLLDNLVGPVLARARVDHDRGYLRMEEVTDLVARIRTLLDDLLGDSDETESGDVVVLGCPAHDSVDQLMLELLARLLPPGKARLVYMSQDATASDVLSRVAEEQPALVVLMGLPPAGSARARYLCKRLRARFPQLPLIATVWAGNDPEGQLASQLRSAGATEVPGSFAQARLALVPLLQVASHQADQTGFRVASPTM